MPSTGAAEPIDFNAPLQLSFSSKPTPNLSASRSLPSGWIATSSTPTSRKRSRRSFYSDWWSTCVGRAGLTYANSPAPASGFGTQQKRKSTSTANLNTGASSSSCFSSSRRNKRKATIRRTVGRAQRGRMSVPARRQARLRPAPVYRRCIRINFSSTKYNFYK